MGEDERNAQRLMQELVRQGARVGTAIPNAHLQSMAIGIEIDGQAQDDAITFAGNSGWITEGSRDGIVVLTQAGWDSAKA